MTDWVGGNTTFTYDAAHQLTSRTFPNGVTENFTYDNDGRPVSIQVAKGSTAISSIALTRDALGRVTSEVRSAPTVPNVPTGYLALSYDAASQSSAATYDSLGRPTQDSLVGRTYTWDLASRLASYSGSNGSSSFTYDAFGQRTSSTTAGVTQNYVLNYALPLPSIATVQTGGADLRYYIWLPSGMLLESIEATGGARHFYHFDESGTTNFLTTDSGAVTDSYATTPYGETIVQTGSTQNPFTFQGALGAMQEGATGIYYMRARYYDSASARFLSRDPIIQRDPRALSPYQFASEMPVEHGDPSGEQELSLFDRQIPYLPQHDDRGSVLDDYGIFQFGGWTHYGRDRDYLIQWGWLAGVDEAVARPPGPVSGGTVTGGTVFTPSFIGNTNLFQPAFLNPAAGLSIVVNQVASAAPPSGTVSGATTPPFIPTLPQTTLLADIDFFYRYLLDGPNKHEWQSWNRGANIAVVTAPALEPQAATAASLIPSFSSTAPGITTTNTVFFSSLSLAESLLLNHGAAAAPSSGGVTGGTVTTPGILSVITNNIVSALPGAPVR